MSGDGEIQFCDLSVYETDILTSKDFPVLKNKRVLQAARGEIPDKLPVWIMRQAGRYLPEFRELRKEHSFFEVCQKPHLACNVTLMPIRRFDLDAAIIFSDILVVPRALGMEVVMGPSGPSFPTPLTTDTLNILNPEGAIKQLDYVGKAITLTRHKLKGKVPLFGFCGAPWTLMSYMIEGGGSKTYSKAKRWLYSNEKASHILLNLLTDVLIDFLILQVQAGAQILQVFDSNAEYLTKDLYEKYGLPYLKKIYLEVKEKIRKNNLEDVPIVLFAKGGSYSLEQQSELGYEVLGLDWTVDPQKFKEIQAKVTFQGNLDPCALYAPAEQLTTLTNNMIKKFGTHPYIVNLGHGIYPDMDIESVQTFIKAVRDFKI